MNNENLINKKLYRIETIKDYNNEMEYQSKYSNLDFPRIREIKLIYEDEDTIWIEDEDLGNYFISTYDIDDMYFYYENDAISKLIQLCKRNIKNKQEEILHLEYIYNKLNNELKKMENR